VVVEEDIGEDILGEGIVVGDILEEDKHLVEVGNLEEDIVEVGIVGEGIVEEDSHLVASLVEVA